MKVIQTGTIRKLGCSFPFAFHSNYMALSCIISQIKQDIGRKSWFFNNLLHLTFGGPRRNIAILFCVENENGGATWWWKNVEDMYNCLDNIPVCDGQTDILPRHSPRYAYVSCSKNNTASANAVNQHCLCSVVIATKMTCQLNSKYPKYHIQNHQLCGKI